MFILENISLDLTSTIIAVTVGIIIYYAWKSTNVREDRTLPATLLIIENNRRQLLDNIVRQSTNIVHSASTQLNESFETEEIEVQSESQEESAATVNDIQIPTAPSLQAIIDEVNDLASSRDVESHYRSVEENFNELFDADLEPQQVIHNMDNPELDVVAAEGMRRRRLEFHTGAEDGAAQSMEGTTNQQLSQRPLSRREHLNLQTGDHFDTSHAENCSNENNENENISKIENRTIYASSSTSSTVANANINFNQNDANEETKNEFCIKLKYLNDELRLVKGSPNEAIGDFKKRNFTMELAAQKLVRLVFNGHVLQPDSKTLKACGLFDNCVVHCLIHSKKPSSSGGYEETRIHQNTNRDQTNIQQGRSLLITFVERNTNGPTLVHLGLTFVTLLMILCWYCRVQYSYLFSWYSTIGLALMTVLFLVMSPLIVLMEREVTT